MKNKKFYEFKNISSFEADLFVYGEIVQEKYVDWWTGEESKTDVDLMGFKEELDSIGNVQTLNIYINSPGGDVFVASTMISMLERQKAKGTKIISYVDGLSASAASFLMMVADEIKLYKNSVVMVHKPMSVAIGNADEMQKMIDVLNKLEDSVMIPMYMSKSKVTEKEVRKLINAESWLSANDMAENFNVTLLDEEKTAVASISSNLFKNYKNIPDFIKNSLKKVENNENIGENAPKNEEIVQNVENSEETTDNSADTAENTAENTAEVTENTISQETSNSKEQEIKARLKLVENSLFIKKIKEKE